MSQTFRTISNHPQSLLETASLLSVLAHPVRLSIFRFLAHSGFGGMCVTDIRQQLSIHTSTAAFHLRVLRQSGLIHERKKERRVYYSADIRLMRSLIAYLNDHCVVPE